MIKYDCIFFDRDGTINYDPGYIPDVNSFKFFHFTMKALCLFKNVSNEFIIITNQSGVGRGLIEEKNLLLINDFIMKELTENNIPLSKIYYCTDHPRNASKRRKPGTGMFLEASKDFDINLDNCLMIGDSITDIQPANALGMDTMLVLTGNGEKTYNNLLQKEIPKYVAKNILVGAELLNQ
tara:strand:- start:742 stop:1284 length:543 start_codon:yes stop_codon:yes gene_type:complete